MTKTEELRDLTLDELEARVRDMDDQLFRLRLQKSMGQLESSAKLRTSRRELARVKTIIREKERA
jgi:large subunit ribosomal protein L29